MPRRSREQSETGIYHIMLRGNEKKDIFIDSKDKEKIIDTIFKVRENDGFRIYAYCIMDNHIHLVMQQDNEAISKSIKRMGTSYAFYYNKKHKRVGHVFQDRYKSEVITSDRQLFEVIRYVHNNPVKAGMKRDASGYEWSSYNYYIGNELFTDNQIEAGKAKTDFDEILGMFSGDRKRAVVLFKTFTNERIENTFLDMEMPDKDSGEEEIRLLVDKCLVENGITHEEIKKDKNKRDHVIRLLKFKEGLAGRKIARVLEINRNIVQKVNEESRKNRPL